MIVAKKDNTFVVLDRTRALVTLSKPLEKLDDIFTTYWISNNRNNIIRNYDVVTMEASSFKGLKHYVAGYLLSNNIEADIPERYVNAYEMNKHIYEGK